MKKNILLLLVLMACCHSQAQTYYRMWRGSGQQGGSEWIANSHLLYSYSGILFETTDKPRAIVNDNGKWIWLDPNDAQLGVRGYIELLNTTLNNLDASNCFMGTTVSNKWGLNRITQNTNIDCYWGYGYYGEVVLKNQLPRWFRIDSNGGVAIWGSGTSQQDSNPQLIVYGKSVDLRTKFNFYQEDKKWLASMETGRNGDLVFSTTPSNWFRISAPAGLGIWANGNVASDDTPSLHVGSSLLTANVSFVQKGGSISYMAEGTVSSLNLDGPSRIPWFGTTTPHGFLLGANNDITVYLDTDKNMFVNIQKPIADRISSDLKTKYDLFVNHGVLSEDFAIAPVNSWADFVFDESYELPSIDTIEKYITDNNHLPIVPSAEEVATNGYSQHEINKIFLQKIEELTLYIIEQKKEIESLKMELKNSK